MPDRFDFSHYSWQVRKFARSLMSSGRTAAEISGRMHLLTLTAEKDLARFGDSSENSLVACGPGCGACCVLNVEVLVPEAITISWFLRRRCSAAKLAALQIRLQELIVRTRWLDDEERIFVREPCAFLDEQGSCLIHAVRPLLCRAITSTDSEHCSEAIAMTALHGAPCIEMNLFQKRLMETVYCELARALEFWGLDHRPRRLSSAVSAFLAEPEKVSSYAAGGALPLN